MSALSLLGKRSETMKTIEPYSDELLKYDESTKKYYLTEQALIREGLPLRDRLAEGSAPSAEYVINGFLKRVTGVIYAYIHSYNTDNDAQDYLISHLPSARTMIYNALINQAIYMYHNGDLTLSKDRADKEAAYDTVALSELNRTRPEIQCSILYTGAIRLWI